MKLTLLSAAAAALLTLSTGAVASETPAVATADASTTPSLSTALFPPAGTVRVEDSPEAIKRLVKEHGADVLVVNFWATWCGPCVEELPYFVNLAKRYPESKVRVVGLSLDFPDQIETGVVPFLRKRGIPYSNVIVYVDDPQQVIEQFSKDWSGELPATFFFDRQGNKLGELAFAVTQEQLDLAVEALVAGKPLPAIKPENH